MVAAVVGLLPPLSGEAQVRIVEDGRARAVVVTADEPTPTASYAAEELVRHIAWATGVSLPTVLESEAPEDVHSRVYLGDTETGRTFGLDPERLPRETFVLRSVGNDLFITGRESDGDPFAEHNPDVGPLFGVYEILERFLGVRWLWPGELGTYVPRTDVVRIPAIDEMSAPALRFRHFSWGPIRSVALGSAPLDPADEKLGFSHDVAVEYGKAVQVLLRRHRIGGMDAKPPSGHAFSGWWQRYGREHPEWFQLRRDGVRGDPDSTYAHVAMCVSNEELQDFVVSQWGRRERAAPRPRGPSGTLHLRSLPGLGRAPAGGAAVVRRTGLRHGPPGPGGVLGGDLGSLRPVLESDLREGPEAESPCHGLRLLHL